MADALPRKHIRSIAFGVALALAWSSLSAPWVEANFRTERRPSDSSPAAADVFPADKLSDILRLLPPAFGSVRFLGYNEDPGKPFIILIRDAHAVPSAQKSIARILDYLGAAASSPGRPLLVGLEGAFGPLDVDGYRRAGRPEHVRVAADYLLSRKRINGTEYHAITTPRAPVLWGVETPSLYEKNVRAYLEERPLKALLEERLDRWELAVENLSAKLLPEKLWRLENDLRDFNGGRLSLTDIVRRLDCAGLVPAGRYPNLVRLMEIADIEAKFSSGRIRPERDRLIEGLAGKLSMSEMDEVLSDAAEFRSGRMGDLDYFEKWADLASRAGISPDEMPGLKERLSASRLTAELDYERMLGELNRAIESRLRLAPAGAARELLQIADDLRCLKSVSQNRLSPEQWRNYAVRRAEVLRLPERLAALSPGTEIDVPPLAKLAGPFERFYRAAEARNRALAGNLWAKARLSGDRAAVLVTGGFHADGVESLLKEMGARVAVVTPSMEPGRINSRYMESFARDPDAIRGALSTSRSTLALMANLNAPETYAMAGVIAGALDALENGGTGRTEGIAISREDGRVLAEDPKTGIRVLAGELPDLKTLRESLRLPVLDLFHIPNSKRALAVLGAAKRFGGASLRRPLAVGAILALACILLGRPEWIGFVVLLGVVSPPSYETSASGALRGDALRAQLAKEAKHGVMDYKMLKWRQLFRLTGRVHWEADLEQRILPALRKAVNGKDKAGLAQVLIALLLIAGLGGSGKTTVLSVYDERINEEIDGLLTAFFSTDNVLLEKKAMKGEPGLPPVFPGLDREPDNSGQPTEFPMKKFQADRVAPFLWTAVKGKPFNAPIFDQSSRGRDRLFMNADGFVVAASRKSQFVLDEDALRRLQDGPDGKLEFPLGSLTAEARLEENDIVVRVLDTDHRLVNYADYLKSGAKSGTVAVLVEGELPQVITNNKQASILQTIDARGKLLIVEGIFSVLDEELLKINDPQVMVVILYAAYNVRRLRMVARGKGQARDQNSEALAEQRDWLTIIEERVLQRYIEVAKKLGNVKEVNAMDDEEAVLALYWLGKLSHISTPTMNTLKQMGFAEPAALYDEIQELIKKDLADRFWNLDPTPQMQSSRFAHYPVGEIFNKVYIGTESEQSALAESVERLLASMGGLMTPTAHQALETPRFVNVDGTDGVARRLAVHDLYSQEKAIPLKDFLKLMVDWGEMDAARSLILRLFSIINDSARRGIVVDPRWMEKYGIIMRGNEQLVAIGLDGASGDIGAYDPSAYLNEEVYLYTSDHRDMRWFEPLKPFYLEHANNKNFLPTKERYAAKYAAFFGPDPDKRHWAPVPAPVDWRLDAKILREVINPRTHPENLKRLKRLWLKSRGARSWERLLWIKMYLDAIYARGTPNYKLVERVYRELTDRPELAELSLEELQSIVNGFLEDEWRSREGKEWEDASKPLPAEAEKDLSEMTTELTRYAELSVPDRSPPGSTGGGNALLFGSIGASLSQGWGSALGVASAGGDILPAWLSTVLIVALLAIAAAVIFRKMRLTFFLPPFLGTVRGMADSQIAIMDVSGWRDLSAADRASYISAMSGVGAKGTVILLTEDGRAPADVVDAFTSAERSEAGGNLIVLPWRETERNAFVIGPGGRAVLDARRVVGLARAERPDLSADHIAAIITFAGQEPWDAESVPEQTDFLMGRGGRFYRIPVRLLSQYLQWQWGVQRFIERFA